MTSRSRLLTNALPEVGPGTSVQASVTRNGLALVLTVPVMVRTWPVAVKRSARCFVVEHVSRGEDVEEAIQVDLTHALIVRRQRVVGAHAGHVAGGIHHQRLGHRRAGRSQTLIDEILPKECGGARSRRARVARARRGRPPLLP